MFCFTKYENYLQLWRDNPHNSSKRLPLLLVGSTPYLISTHYSVCPLCMQKDCMIDAVKQGCYFHKRGRLNPVIQEWWGTSELRRQYISLHQIMYYLYSAAIFILTVQLREEMREIEFLCFWFISLWGLSPSIFGVLSEFCKKQKWPWPYSFKIFFNFYMSFYCWFLNKYSHFCVLNWSYYLKIQSSSYFSKVYHV